MSGPLTNQRHERFAREVASGKSAGEAYLAAGYGCTPASAHASGHLLLKKIDIIDRVKEIHAAATKRVIWTREKLIEEQAKVYEAAKDAKDFGPTNTALKQLAVLTANWDEKKTVNADLTVRQVEWHVVDTTSNE